MASVPRIRITDGFVEAVRLELASVPPERGGAILSFGGTAHLLLSDSRGQYSRSSWFISREISEAVGILEGAGRGQLIGTVHSHPQGVPDPSHQDVSTTTKALDLNPHLTELLIAIVTQGTPRELDVHIGDQHRMSIHVLRRQLPNVEPELLRAGVTIHPVASDLRAAHLAPAFHISVDDVLRGETEIGLPRVIRADSREVLAVSLPSSPTSFIFMDSLHPVVTPLAVSLNSEGDFETHPSPWDPTRSSHHQFRALVRRLASSPDPDQWTRVRDITGALEGRRVFVAGAGSIGSRIAEDLVRCGVQSIVILDPDVVSVPNLARSVYSAADLDLPKVEALARRLKEISPTAEVVSLEMPLSEMDAPMLLEEIDLVVMATDDMGEQAHLAHWAYHLGVPSVACAMYRKGAAGEVVLVVPAANSPCWSCTVGADSRSAGLRPDADYGLTGRLVGESALGPSINLVSSVASQLAVGLLAGPGSPAGETLGRLVAERRTLGLVSTTPAWDFFPEVLGGAGHQHAPQSVWPTVEARSDCEICGPVRRRPMDLAEGRRLALDLLELASAETGVLPREKQQRSSEDNSSGSGGE